jgi:hypothetical protein
MGATQALDPDAAIWVYPEAVAASLRLQPSTTRWSPRERAEFGRALGRVVAHEIVHAILRTQEHAHSGLMAAVLTQAALKASALDLDPVTQQRVMRALAVRTTEAAPESPETSAHAAPAR